MTLATSQIRLTHSMSIGLLVSAILVGTSVSSVVAQPIRELVVFGDSHSDVGNWAGAGRFSEKTNWIDELAHQFDVPFTAPSREGGLNYAMGGATTGHGADQSGNTSIPQVGTQIATYLESHSPSDEQLFVMLVGHNDFGWREAQSIDFPLSQLTSHVQTLADAGVKHLIVSNVPPLASLPAYLDSDREETLRGLIPSFNEAVADALDELQTRADIDIYQVDFFGMVNEMIQTPSDFGFLDVTTRAADVAEADPDEYLHWDDHHYTSATYAALGRRAAEILPPDFKATFLPLVEPHSTWRFFPGRVEPSPFPGLAWASNDFDDAAWQEGIGGFGFGQPNDVEKVETLLDDMRGQYQSVYIRRHFVVDDPTQLESLRLFVDYDDAFIAYINGTEVARSDFGTVGEPVALDGSARRGSRELGFRDIFEIGLADFPNLLEPKGDNVLAIQGLNRRLSDRDFGLANLRLDAIAMNVVPEPRCTALSWLAFFGLVWAKRRSRLRGLGKTCE